MSPGEASNGLFRIDVLEDSPLRPRPWKSSAVLRSKRDTLIAGSNGGKGLSVRSGLDFAGIDIAGLGWGCTFSKPYVLAEILDICAVSLTFTGLCGLGGICGWIRVGQSVFLFLLRAVVEVFWVQESRHWSKKQQKVSQNHEDIVCTEEDDMDADIEVDRHLEAVVEGGFWSRAMNDSDEYYRLGRIIIRSVLPALQRCCTEIGV